MSDSNLHPFTTDRFLSQLCVGMGEQKLTWSLSCKSFQFSGGDHQIINYTKIQNFHCAKCHQEVWEWVRKDLINWLAERGAFAEGGGSMWRGSRVGGSMGACRESQRLGRREWGEPCGGSRGWRGWEVPNGDRINLNSHTKHLRILAWRW